jgi:hypothetical protein
VGGFSGTTMDRPALQTARGRAAQLFAGSAHLGARLIDDADPEHDAVITPSEAVKALSLTFQRRNSSFLRRGSYSAVIWAGSRARRWTARTATARARAAQLFASLIAARVLSTMPTPNMTRD